MLFMLKLTKICKSDFEKRYYAVKSDCQSAQVILKRRLINCIKGQDDQNKQEVL